VRLDRAGEPYGAIALPPPRSRMPFWLALAKVAPLVVALSTLMPWGTAYCPSCFNLVAVTLYPLELRYVQYPWILPWGWGLLVSALLVLSSLGFASSSIRRSLRATGVVLGAVSLALPLSMAFGVFLDPAGLFVVRAAPGLWISTVAYVVMSLSSLRA
jgi:hypothetical protein